MKYTFIPAFIILSILRVSAQVNTEKYRSPDAEEGLGGLIELDFNIETGNVEFREINYELGLTYGSANYYSFVVGQGDFKWQGGRQFSSEALWHLRYVRIFGERIQGEIFIQYDRNLARLLTLRGLAGGGVRYLVFSDERNFLWLGAAYMYEKENFDVNSGDIGEVTKYSHRASFHLSLHLPINERTVLNSVVYYQPRLTDPEDYNILSESSLIFGIWKALNFGVSFKFRYDTSPPRGDIKKMDTKTLMGIIIKI